MLQGIPAKKYDLVLSSGAEPRLKDWVKNQTRSLFLGVLLQDTLGLEDDLNYLPLQPNALSVSFLLQGTGFEHFAFFSVALAAGFLTVALVRLYKE